MSGEKAKYGVGRILLIIGLLFSLAVFGYRVYSNYYQMPIDFLIFLKSGRDFQESGKLYQRAENYTEKYSPSAAIYKFPPPFQLALVPLAKMPRSINQLVFIKPLLIGIYVLSIFLLYRLLATEFMLSGQQRFYFATLLTITSAWFMPFFESIRWLLAEIPLLLIFITSFIFIGKNRITSILSGMLIAFASCIKIYPVFMAGNLLKERNRWGLAGFFAGLAITASASVYFFGMDEHVFYINHILPVLLNEEVASKWINLNLEKFLFSMGLISEISGNIFFISRILFLSIFVILLVKYRKELLGNAFLEFSFYITTMFFCFPNYWPQYQIYLIIPMAYLMASYLKTGAFTARPVMLMMAAIVLFIPDNLWNSMLILKVPVFSIISLLLYEARSLATIFIWLLLAREIHALKNSPAH